MADFDFDKLEEADEAPAPLHRDFSASGVPEALARDGFCRLDRFLPEEDIPALRAQYDERLRCCSCPRNELDCAVRWDDPTATPFMRVLLDERLLGLLTQICGSPFVAISMDFFGKAPHSDTFIPWHQDTYTTRVGYLWTEERAANTELPHPVTLWVALDDVSKENGGMEMVRGRHKELLFKLHPSRSMVPEEFLQEDEKVDYRLKAGQAGLHHPLAPHRSCCNATGRTRRIFSFQLAPWTEKLREACGAPESLGPQAAARGWPTWRSAPAGRFCWIPGDERVFREGKSISRLMVCCKSEN